MIEPNDYRLPEDYILPEAPWKDWRVVKRLGKESYGTVYEIERVTDFFTEKAAMIVISIPLDQHLVKHYQSEGYDDKSISDICKSYLQDTVREYKLMRSLKGNEYIVSCDDIDYSEKKDSIGWNVYIRMELLTPFLEDPKSNNLDELDIIRLGKDICQALIKCESKNIIHRDVKPGNIFVSKEGNYKLGDFGVARTLNHAINATRVGTQRFMAPEVIKQDKYGKDVDLYSLGLVLYWLLNGRRMPFLNADKVPTAHENQEAYSKRLNGICFGPPKNGSLFLKRVVLKACAYERSERYQSADEMLQALSRAEELYIKEQSSVPHTSHSPVSDAKTLKN